ncbi:MAG: PLP-dependent aminotransferase family protein [Leptolyngbya sp. DLM2.Bin15]|nr:MAG: PLP-dependent aminotransferase family protein [Leptolyngbya sp. DLM2.Bin15]
MAMTPLDLESDKSLYEQVADRLENLIYEGTLKPGDRLPSVRKLREQLSVSISTVLEAYRVLEDRGMICARPQSGYYVRQTALQQPQEPATTDPPKRVYDIDNSLTFRLMHAIQDPKILKLGAAVPVAEHLPLTALNRLMGQVLRQHSAKAHSYDAPPGCIELRREVAKRMLTAGCSINPDQIVTTNGTFEAVYLSLRAVTQPGDTVAIESPTYYGLLEALEMLHLKVLELPTHPRDGLSLDDLETAMQRQQITACVLVSNFSNPLGTCMGDAKKKQLADLLERYDMPLIEDDIYGDLYFEGNRPKAIKAFDRSGRVLYCASCSKTLSPGMRVGWAIAGRYQAKVEQLKWVLNQTTAIAPQLTLAAFLANGGYDRHLRQLRRKYQMQTAQMTQAICDYFPAETKVTRPNGGHVLWLELPPEFDSIQLYEEALAQNISIAPGVIFSASSGYRNCFRLNCSLPWTDDVEQAMRTIGYLAKKQLAVTMLSQPF